MDLKGKGFYFSLGDDEINNIFSEPKANLVKILI